MQRIHCEEEFRGEERTMCLWLYRVRGRFNAMASLEGRL